MIDRDEIEIKDDRLGPLLIAGPTASGKSSLALHLAHRYDGEIVNADAMQVYKNLPILTACPTEEEQRKAPHHLYSFLDGAERCSAGIWVRKAANCVNSILERGKRPIIVGGTGLYFKALVEGLSPVPDVSEETRAAGERRYTEIGGVAFRDEVIAIDPAMERLPPADRQRLVRAWSVYCETKRPLSFFQAIPREKLLPQITEKFVLYPNRDILYSRCDTRFRKMMAAGALNEVEALCARNLAADLPVMKSLGVRELSAFLEGYSTLESAVEAAEQSTRRFAKRQLTWFRNQTSGWTFVA